MGAAERGADRVVLMIDSFHCHSGISGNLWRMTSW